MWFILENVSCVLEKNVYSPACGWNVVYISIKSNDLMCLLRLVFPYWLSFWMICPLMEGAVKDPYYYCVTVNFYIYICQYLLYVFKCSYVRCIYIYNCYISLDWFLDHYVMSFFVSYNSLHFEVYFVWYKYCFPCFLLISIFAWNTFFHSLTFSLCVSLDLK